MKKFLMTCAAVMGVSLAFAATSFAATYTADGNTVSIDQTKLTGLTADDQITVIVVKAEDGEIPTTINDEKILYINQEKNDSSFSKFQGMKLKGDSLDDGTYIIAVGGSKLDEIITDTFTVGGEEEPTILYGDVYKDGKVNNKDSAYLQKYLAKWTGFDATTCDLDAADVYKDGKLNNRDSATLQKYLAKWSGFEALPILPAN